jgi:hypothetical protein
MSLINDALKRAELDKRQPPSAPPGERVADYQFVATAPARKARPARGYSVRNPLILAAVVALGLGGILGYAHWAGQRPAQLAQAGGAPETQPDLKVTVAPSPLPNARSPSPAVAPSATPLTPANPTTPPVKPAPAAPVAARLPTPTPPPTVATSAPAEGAAEFTLGGIVQSADSANAIVNDHLVTIGDEVNGAKVVSIKKYSVILEKDGKQITLRM